METLMISLMLWLSANFGLPMPPTVPEVTYLPETVMRDVWVAELSVKSRERSKVATRLGVRAMYQPDARLLILPDGFDSDEPRDRSLLVHELVHHMQTASGRTYPCAPEREAKAFEAQITWLEERGFDFYELFETNPLSLRLATVCLPFEGAVRPKAQSARCANTGSDCVLAHPDQLLRMLRPEGRGR